MLSGVKQKNHVRVDRFVTDKKGHKVAAITAPPYPQSKKLKGDDPAQSQQLPCGLHLTCPH